MQFPRNSGAFKAKSSFYIFAILLSLTWTITFSKNHPYMEVNRFDEDFPLFDSVSGTPYKNCGGSRSILKSVEVTPCDLKDVDHCVITRGSNVTFKLTFLSQENSKTLTAKLYGIIDYFPLPFPCPQPNACENSGISCPILAGHLYNYTLSAPILKKYPKKSLWIEGELMDDNRDSLICVKIPVKIE